MVWRLRVRISEDPPLFTFLKKPCPLLSPSQLLSTIFCSQAGITNALRASSVGQLSYTPFATFTIVSMPTTSAVRKVADLGLPMMGPVSASTSSMVSPILSTRPKMAMMPYTPIRLAMNAGVSLQSTVVLPR